MQPVTDTEAVQRLFNELAGEHDQHIPFFATFGRSLAASQHSEDISPPPAAR